MPKNNTVFYFGTEEYQRAFPVPVSGANVSPEGWSDAGTLLGGGGYAQHSWDSHKTYQFEWSGASSRLVAQAMHSFRDGAYGKGLLFFHDPLTYDTNVLPKRWADPSMAVREPSATLVYGTKPTGTPTSSWMQNELPLQSASYSIASLPTSVAAGTSLYIPIPPGHVLALGAFYTSSLSTAGVYVTEIDDNGNNATTSRLTPQSTTASSVVSNYVAGRKAVRLWVGRTAGTSGTVTLSGMIARIFTSRSSAESVPVTGFGNLPISGYAPAAQARVLAGPWIGGQGHSGCRFEGEPTYINNTGVGGGQVGFAASLIEVGTWSRG